MINADIIIDLKKNERRYKRIVPPICLTCKRHPVLDRRSKTESLPHLDRLTQKMYTLENRDIVERIMLFLEL